MSNNWKQKFLVYTFPLLLPHFFNTYLKKWQCTLVKFPQTHSRKNATRKVVLKKKIVL